MHKGKCVSQMVILHPVFKYNSIFLQQSVHP